MSAQPSIPGTGIGSARNGLPPSREYVYRGSGEDQLTPPGVMAAWNARVRKHGASPRPTNKADTARLREVENELAAATATPQASPPARPAPPRQLADLERELTARGVISPSPEPAPDPGRCPDCGYLLTAPGHETACGGEA